MAVKKGFSLIELTVVIGLLSLLTLAISSVMLMSIITSNRLRTTTKIKQAGSYALGEVQSLLRNAKTIVSCDSDADTIEITNPDGGQTIIATESDGTNTRIASGAGIYLTPEKTEIPSFNLTCEPSDINPSLITFSFDLQDKPTVEDATTPALHFETAINLRNVN